MKMPSTVCRDHSVAARSKLLATPLAAHCMETKPSAGANRNSPAS
ncbi:TPA: hypothetical protein N0F65_010764 [Lagenidium giganteum]|uniref:Uncharacterized protein n=1 Tax=Lagenidium giganteum TaxID=4803 RepID=A0AAV2YIR8_9STRA|nr:TPA: hypothetical protein N0F65_010764 [Lagenidium giganteum]